MLAGVGDIIQELMLLMLIWILFCFKSIVNCSYAMFVERRFLSPNLLMKRVAVKVFIEN